MSTRVASSQKKISPCPEHHGDAVEKGRRYGDGDEGHHGRLSLPQLLDGAPEEGETAPAVHERAQGQQHVLVARKRQGS